jgi:hypothetical protein
LPDAENAMPSGTVPGSVTQVSGSPRRSPSTGKRTIDAAVLITT